MNSGLDGGMNPMKALLQVNFYYSDIKFCRFSYTNLYKFFIYCSVHCTKNVKFAPKTCHFMVELTKV